MDTVKTVLQQAAAPRGVGGTVWALGAGELYRGVLPAALSMAPWCAVRIEARPKKSSPNNTLNRRTLYRKSPKIPISGPRLTSPISWA